MAAGAAPGPPLELCPHCRRPFKRLRAHLPHCKAAPPPAPGNDPRSGPAGASQPAPSAGPGSGRRSGGARPSPAGAPGTSPQPSPATGSAAAPRAAPGPSPGPGTGRGAGLGTGRGTGPGTGRGADPGTGRGAGPGTGRDADPGTGRGAGPGTGRDADPGTGRGAGPAAPRSGSRAVRDVARSLDLHPEEVEDVPRLLRKGVKVVIEKHRARVLREKEPRGRAAAAGSPGEGTEPGPAPQRRKTAQKSKSKEAGSQGTAGTGSSKGGKSSLKATKALQEPPESRNSPGGLIQQEGRDKFTAGEDLEAVRGSEPPVSALHPQNLRLSLTGALGGPGTPKNDLSSLRGLWGSGEGAPVGLRRAPELPLPHTPQTLPPCPARGSGSGAAGLEWFPDLYPDGEGLRIFPGKRFLDDARITAVTPEGGLAQGPQGPLGERPLLEVRLGELHTWISTCNFSPQGLLGAVQRAWSSYCAKYIHVKQGGPAGISMLLAGYCLLSYGWNYQHLKRHRWRKYH